MTDKQNYFTYTDNTSDDNDKTMENLHKQIIIDGVDVSGCEFCFNGCCGSYGYVDCTDEPHCAYKNWQRAEKKLEKIAKVCDKFMPDHFKILLIINGGVIEE